METPCPELSTSPATPQHLLRAEGIGHKRPQIVWGYSSATLTLLGPQNPSSGLSEASWLLLPQVLDHTHSLASRETASPAPSAQPPHPHRPRRAQARGWAPGPGVYAWGPGRPRAPCGEGRETARPRKLLSQQEKGLPPYPPLKRIIYITFPLSERVSLWRKRQRDPLGEEGGGKIPRARACAVPARHDVRVSRARVTRLLSGARVGAPGRGGGL